MRADDGSTVRKLFFSVWCASSPIAPASSTPVGPPPTMTKLSLGTIAVALCGLERFQELGADRGGIFDRLQPGRVGRPRVVAEVVMGRTGREDEVVVADALARRGRLDARRRRCLVTSAWRTANVFVAVSGSRGAVPRCPRETTRRWRLGRGAVGTGGSCADR